MEPKEHYKSIIGEEEEVRRKHLRIAVIGCSNSGKTTFIVNFLKGYLDPESAPNLDMDAIVKNSKGVYEVELQYNDVAYTIEIHERPLRRARGDYLESFNGVVYLFSLNDADSFILMQEFYRGQKIFGNKPKPRVAIGTRLDVISDDEYEKSFEFVSNDVVTPTGKLNFAESRKWVIENMGCDYAEINAHEPANVDEVFLLLIGIIERTQEEERLKKKQQIGISFFDKLVSVLTLEYTCQFFLSMISLFGILQLGAAFYSGTKPQVPHDDNWLYVIMLFLGIFSFIAGVVGFYGVKHKSKEYLKAILIILIPLSAIYLAYTIVFFVKMHEVEVLSKNILTPASTKAIAVINSINMVLKAFGIYTTIKVHRRFTGLDGQLPKGASTMHVQYTHLPKNN